MLLEQSYTPKPRTSATASTANQSTSAAQPVANPPAESEKVAHEEIKSAVDQAHPDVTMSGAVQVDSQTKLRTPVKTVVALPGGGAQSSGAPAVTLGGPAAQNDQQDDQKI